MTKRKAACNPQCGPCSLHGVLLGISDRLIRKDMHASHQAYLEFPTQSPAHTTMPRGMRRADHVTVHQADRTLLALSTARSVVPAAFEAWTHLFIFDQHGNLTLDLVPPSATSPSSTPVHSTGGSLRSEIEGRGIGYKCHILAVARHSSFTGNQPLELRVDLASFPPRTLLEAAAAEYLGSRFPVLPPISSGDEGDLPA